MEIDGGQIASGTTIEADVCIIGAGPAGLVVAEALAAGGRDVVILESGTASTAASALALNDGEVEGDPYAGLRSTRHRGVGGTSMLWNTPTPGGPGAKYLPLDPWDLERRWAEAPDGWPLSYASLAPHYVRAHRRCGLGPMAYHAAAWHGGSSAPADDTPEVTSAVYQFGSREALMASLVTAVRTATNARLYVDATVVQLAVVRGGVVLSVAHPLGRRWEVRARRVVLAAGAVENARLLLVAKAAGRGVDDRSGWLGCGFMEHPRDRALALTIAASGYRALSFYDLHVAADGTSVAGRLALGADAARAGVEGAGGGTAGEPALLNASATLLPIVRPWRSRLRGRLARFGTIRALQRWLPAGGHGWSTHPAPERVFTGFTVLLNVEQPPHRENAVVLGRRRDAYGVPLPLLRWRWFPEDHASLLRLRAVFGRAIESTGWGRVSTTADVAPDPNAHHHAGTTRMHADARYGVVDADGRVHGTEGVFVVGASTFPTAGFANPTLTIVALALRLADRLLTEG